MAAINADVLLDFREAVFCKSKLPFEPSLDSLTLHRDLAAKNRIQTSLSASSVRVQAICRKYESGGLLDKISVVRQESVVVSRAISGSP
jgi:hypothetical protein